MDYKKVENFSFWTVMIGMIMDTSTNWDNFNFRGLDQKLFK